MEGTEELPPTLTPNPTRCCRDVYKYDAVNHAGTDACNSGLILTTLQISLRRHLCTISLTSLH